VSSKTRENPTSARHIAPRIESIVDDERVHVDSVRAIAATIGAPPVDADAARALASDCEYRLRQVFQDAMKCMRASKRTTLSAEVRAKTRAKTRCERRG